MMRMLNTFKQPLLIIIFPLIIFLRGNCAVNPPKGRYVVIGYVAGFYGLINTDLIRPEQLTHLNYAFATIKNNRVVLANVGYDTVNVSKLNGLKKINPDLKILISIGGWMDSNHFSDVALSDTSRNAFASSAVELVRKYNLDGIDIDWEYPGEPGKGNIYRTEDKHNFTLLLKACREKLDHLAAQSKNKLSLTIAAGCSASFLKHTEMKKAQQYLDYVNLMAYDFTNDLPGKAFHHAGLFPSKIFINNTTISQSVDSFLQAGVLPGKMVLGVPFYGHVYKSTNELAHTSGIALLTDLGTRGFTLIKDSLLNSGDFQYRKDRVARAVYLFSRERQEFVTFDDEWSLKQKCKYLKNQRLAGIMFWEYSNDQKGSLLKEIDHQLR